MYLIVFTVRLSSGFVKWRKVYWLCILYVEPLIERTRENVLKWGIPTRQRVSQNFKEISEPFLFLKLIILSWIKFLEERIVPILAYSFRADSNIYSFILQPVKDLSKPNFKIFWLTPTIYPLRSVMTIASLGLNGFIITTHFFPVISFSHITTPSPYRAYPNLSKIKAGDLITLLWWNMFCLARAWTKSVWTFLKLPIHKLSIVRLHSYLLVKPLAFCIHTLALTILMKFYFSAEIRTAG